MEFVSPAVRDAPLDDGLGEALVCLVQEGLRHHGRLCLRLQGESMWPTIPAGSLVEVEPVSTHDIKLGDVVVWQRDGKLVAHRVVQRMRAEPGVCLITKGDNCSSSDRGLPMEAVLGRVRRTMNADPAALGRGWFWVLRWHVRRFPDRLGRQLPGGLRALLKSLRDRAGRLLSRGFEVLWLRR
jgi:hypothetical protein